jgi:hypothetical protein
MRDTPPPPAIEDRQSPVLLDDLCIALRQVGVWDTDLPSGPTVRRSIEKVRAIDAELKNRNVDADVRLRELSEQTHWQMEKLLQDCRDYPQTIPYVRDDDGIRRRLRCSLCRKQERPANAKQFWMCNSCISRVVDSIQRRQPIDKIILFRTYNSGARCGHADSDTVLATEAWNDVVFGNCKRCFEDELAHRSASPAIVVDGPA